jgi:hypothetical protein
MDDNRADFAGAGYVTDWIGDLIQRYEIGRR